MTDMDITSILENLDVASVYETRAFAGSQLLTSYMKT